METTLVSLRLVVVHQLLQLRSHPVQLLLDTSDRGVRHAQRFQLLQAVFDDFVDGVADLHNDLGEFDGFQSSWCRGRLGHVGVVFGHHGTSDRPRFSHTSRMASSSPRATHSSR